MSLRAEGPVPRGLDHRLRVRIRQHDRGIVVHVGVDIAACRDSPPPSRSAALRRASARSSGPRRSSQSRRARRRRFAPGRSASSETPAARRSPSDPGVRRAPPPAASRPGLPCVSLVVGGAVARVPRGLVVHQHMDMVFARRSAGWPAHRPARWSAASPPSRKRRTAPQSRSACDAR